MMTTGETSEKIPVLLTALDAERFVFFQNNYEKIKTIIDSGIFTTRNGSVTLFFNSDGILMEIEQQRKLFRRGKGLDN